jgi:hypothetical protein
MAIFPKDLVDRGRVLLHGAIYAESGNRLPPIRYTRGLLRFANDLAGRPLCSADELQRRHDALRAAEEAVHAERSAPAAKAHREAAPVVLYVTDQDLRTRKKIEDILKGREIPFTVNDVTDDEASRSWALTQAHKAEFPLVFVAGEPLGDLDDVMQLDVRGELIRKVFG